MQLILCRSATGPVQWLALRACVFVTYHPYHSIDQHSEKRYISPHGKESLLPYRREVK